jgi:hypothetical protein
MLWGLRTSTVPDLASSRYHLFGPLKGALRGCFFTVTLSWRMQCICGLLPSQTHFVWRHTKDLWCWTRYIEKQETMLKAYTLFSSVVRCFNCNKYIASSFDLHIQVLKHRRATDGAKEICVTRQDRRGQKERTLPPELQKQWVRDHINYFPKYTQGSIIHNNNVRSSIRNVGCLQIFSSLLGSWR